ncbi:MAG TPA: hypothetical protein VFR63_11325 [Gaiellaceae bacterium]|nr:hypothetical protein [Gaiellaceae bacterium]
MGLLLAHGIGGFKDLPVPLWLFYYGAALVLLLSFVALWVLWKRPLLRERADGRPLPEALERIVLGRALRALLGALGVVLLVVVTLAAVAGDRTPNENLAPTFVYVVFWLWLVPVVVLLGNVWSALNPWRAAADGVAWLWERAAGPWTTPFAYPAGLGRWPAALLLFAFAALELAYTDPANPRSLAVAIVVYSVVTWLGMLAFGRDAWTASGEAFSVYFGFLARVAPLGVREDGRAVVRWPFTALTRIDLRPGTLAFLAVMLGSVAFDGLSRTEQWVDFRANATRPLGERSTQLQDLVGTLMNVAGLALVILLVALAYLVAVRAAAVVTEYPGDLSGAFLGSLVPIALAYVVAHYVSLVVLQGQYMAPLVSDPLGRGWDLFGTAGVRPDLGVLSPNAVWYTQVAALVVGHVAGLALAHDRAVELFDSPRKAAASQYAMLALMVVYTVAGLWLLSSG